MSGRHQACVILLVQKLPNTVTKLPPYDPPFLTQATGQRKESETTEYGVPLSLLESGGSVSSPDPGYNTVHNTPEQAQLCTTSRIQMLCDQTSYRHDLAHHLHTRSFLSPLQATANIQFHWFPGTFHTTVHDDLLIRAIITAGNFRATSLSGAHAFVACSCSGSDRNSLLK